MGFQRQEVYRYCSFLSRHFTNISIDTRLPERALKQSHELIDLLRDEMYFCWGMYKLCRKTNDGFWPLYIRSHNSRTPRILELLGHEINRELVSTPSHFLQEPSKPTYAGTQQNLFRRMLKPMTAHTRQKTATTNRIKKREFKLLLMTPLGSLQVCFPSKPVN